jgi:hypothetical protein
MRDLYGLTWPVILAFGNLILSSAIVITAFSLLGYMVTHNLRSAVAQAFNLLLACVLIVFAGDIVIPRVESTHAAIVWLRFQWIGIALVPAAYLHFSDAVLRTTHHFSTKRRAVVIGSYIFSAALVPVALFTDLLVYDGLFAPPVSHLSAGPLFPLFVVYFLLTAVYGAYNVYRARRRCLTPAAHRRMTYLTISFAAPGLGVFPYLVSLGFAVHTSSVIVLLLAMAANAAVGTMLVLMAYSVAYYGVLTPDRVVKQDLFHYLLRGPIVGILVIVVMLVIPRVELVLGLPRDTVLVFAVVGVIVIGQLIVNVAKPWIDRFLFSQDREEITWIQELERRLLTSSDLTQFLTNVLAGLCELFRVDTGFTLVQTEKGLQVGTAVGDAEAARRFAAQPDALTAWQHFAQAASRVNGKSGRLLALTSEADVASVNGTHLDSAAVTGLPLGTWAGDSTDGLSSAGTLCTVGEFWLWPLRSRDGEKLLGALGVRARILAQAITDDERAEADMLLAQAAAALSDRYVQEGIFNTLQRILPDLERIQEWRSALNFAPPSAPVEEEEVEAADDKTPAPGGGMWQQWVKDALSHYWGGPKLTNSPLLGLRVMRRALRENDDNVPRALRGVLQEAIERQRPAGERKLTASEWLLYNILDLRFVQGQRVRDIASRLAISESDLYRKQRVAIAEVAKTLAEMEEETAATTESVED